MPEENQPPTPSAETEPDLPETLPILPARDIVLYPDMVLPLVVDNGNDVKLVDQVLLGERMLVVCPITSPPEDDEAELDPAHLFGHACAAVILKMLKYPDNTVRILVQGVKRLRLGAFVQEEPFLVARIEPLADRIEDTLELSAVHRSLRAQFEKLIGLLPNFPEEVKVAALNIDEPGRFADLVASNINLSMPERCDLLAEADVHARLEKLAVMLGREIQIVELGSKIQDDVKEKIGQGQREYFLREQLKAIRQELGEEDGRYEMEELAARIDAADLPEEARKEADRELARLERMQAGSAEYTVARTYLDWLVALPWGRSTEDRLDIKRARRVLDDDHYDLEKVKNRIVEYLAVRKIHPAGRSPILCLVGPPGVGKTSLGQSIARAMGRAFVRHSLGGVRDEAEIRGHRRTYIGALPGRIVQGLRKAESNNPIFMLDEVDKLVSDFRGDPASALLEVLDPEQNSAFSDHYLDVAFNLSKVIFIATANTTDTVPAALLDRMEVLTLPGYTDEEKVQIARRFLVPRVLADHGIAKSRLRVPVAAIRRIIHDYTREAGVRNLGRELATVVRKIAVKIAAGRRGPFRVKAADLPEYLGPKKFFGEILTRGSVPGVAIGLVWTPVGGDILYIESTRMAGKKTMQLTGSLGEVIKESAHAALSWIRTHALKLGIHEDFFETSDIHIHFPAGATPKDGPSAGLALVASLVSLLLERKIRPRLAMTGEISLRGKVLPVGGVKEKALGARRAGIKHVLLPTENMSDLEDLPPEVERDLTFHPVDTVMDMIPLAFPPPGNRRAGDKKRGRGR